MIEMPKLRPLPIETKGKNIFLMIFIWIFSSRKWEVVEDWEFTLPNGVKIVIPKGFVCDGASVPKMFWILLSPTGLLLIPGIIHDHGYRYKFLWYYTPEGKLEKMHGTRTEWDKLFRKVAIQVNGFWIINSLAFLMVYLLGWFPWWRNSKKNFPELYPGMT